MGKPRAICLPRAIRGCRIGLIAAVENDAGEVDLQSTKNVKWVAKLGHLTTGSPVVSRGKVFIGTTWEDGKEACFLCLDEETGRLLGSFICPRPRRDNLERLGYQFNPHD